MYLASAAPLLLCCHAKCKAFHSTSTLGYEPLIVRLLHAEDSISCHRMEPLMPCLTAGAPQHHATSKSAAQRLLLLETDKSMHAGRKRKGLWAVRITHKQSTGNHLSWLLANTAFGGYDTTAHKKHG
jgi:hypothetical protein